MFKYNPEISLGSIAETISVILAIGGMAVIVSNKLAVHDEKILSHDKELVRIEQEHAKDIAKLQADDVESRAQMRSDIRDLSADIKEIDRKIERFSYEKFKAK